MNNKKVKKKAKVVSRLKKYFNNGGTIKPTYTFAQAEMPNKIDGGLGKGRYVTANYNQPKIDGTNLFVQSANTIAPVISALGEQEQGYQDVGAKAASGALQGAATGASIGSVAGPWGTVIGGAIGAVGGGIYSGITAGKNNESVRARLKAEKERERQRKEDYAKSVLNTYPTSGVKGAEYYQEMGGKIKYMKGGKMKYQVGGTLTPPVIQTNGGMVVPNSNNTAVAVGNSHAQGGIEIGQNEIEGGEVLQNDTDGINVFSDKLEYKPGVTFADEAQRLSDMKGKYENKLNSNSPFDKGTGKRQVQKLDSQLKDLFNEQEMMKQEKGIENFGNQAQYGKKMYATPFQQLLPYADNITNAILTAKTPKIPEPVYDRALPLDTTFNIRPQVAESNAQLNKLQKNLERNTQDSNVLRNQMIGATLGNIKNLNALYGQKENIETQLTNQDRLNTQQIGISNVAKENQYNMQKMHRIDDVHQRISANAADAASNAAMQVREQNQFQRDLAELEIMKRKYQETGVWDRNLEGIFQEYLSGENEDNLLKKAKKLGDKAVKFVRELLQVDANKYINRKIKKNKGVNPKSGGKTFFNTDGGINMNFNPSISERYGTYTG